MKPTYLVGPHGDGFLAADEDFLNFFEVDDHPELHKRELPRMAGVTPPRAPHFRFQPLVGHPAPHVTMIGIPFAEATSVKQSLVARFEDVLRIQSAMDIIYPRFDDRYTSGLLDLDEEEPLMEGLVFEDLGSLDCRAGVQQALGPVFDHAWAQSSVLFSIGGDHSITYAAVRSLLERVDRPVLLLDFDAHHDCGTKPIPEDHVHHANFIRHLLDEERIAGILQFGVRGVRSVGKLLKHPKLHQISAAKMTPESVRELIRRCKREHPEAVCYLTFDIDCLDPSVFPHVDFPIGNGPAWPVVVECLRTVFREAPPIIAADLVEGQGKLVNNRVAREFEFAVRLMAHLLDGIGRQRGFEWIAKHRETEERHVSGTV